MILEKYHEIITKRMRTIKSVKKQVLKFTNLIIKFP